MDVTCLNLETIREWHDYFDSAGMDVFEVIENAIKVAIWYRPDEFLMRRDEIAQILFKKQSVQPYTGVINHRRDETQDSSSASSSKTLSAENDFGSHVVKEQRAEKIMNKEKEFPNVEDVQINELVKITSPKLNKEAKVEEQPKSTLESTSCTAAEISKNEEGKFSSTREEQKPKARKIIKINLSTLRNKGERFPIFEYVESGVAKSQISCARSEVCNEAKQTKNLVSGPWDELVAATRKTELLTTSSIGKLFPNLEKDVQNAPERSLKQIPEGKINKKGKVQEHPKPSDKGEEALELKLEAAKRNSSGPWDELVAATRKTELLTTSSIGKLFPNLEKDVQNAPERSLKQIPERKINKKGKVQEHPKPSDKGEEALELKLEAAKRKLHERYDRVQNARKKIQRIGELPRPLPVDDKTKKTRNHIRYNIRML